MGSNPVPIIMENNNKYYISLDQSTTCTGYCVWDGMNIIAHGYMDLKKVKDGRITKMIESIVELFKKYPPFLVTIEDTALQTNAKTLKDLAQLQGMIIGYCVCNGIAYNIYSPTQWRSLLNFKMGKGTKRPVLKQEAIEYVNNTFGLESKEDEAEAICIGSAVLTQFLDK